MRGPGIVVVVVVVSILAAACGVAPVRHDRSAAPPPQWTYAGRHGRPLAYTGGVCELATPHRHNYPPSPTSAFVDTPQGLRDTRKMWAFFDPHPHHGRTCFREGWHLHLEPPDAALGWDDKHAAYRA